MSNISIKTAIVALLCGILSCTPRTAVRTAYPQASWQVPVIDIKKPVCEISLFVPEPELKKIEPPKVEITENFTSTDKNHVRSKDKKLFAKVDHLIIDLDLLAKDAFAFPLPGGKVISPYAGRRRNHTGVDLKTRANDTIVAAFDGIVRLAKPYSAYGNVIVIRHYNGLETVYSHNSKHLVKPEDVVKAGTPIALTGRTGRASTEHVHFETRINGEHFNPAIIIDFETRQLKRNCFVFTQTPKGYVKITPAAIARPSV